MLLNSATNLKLELVSFGGGGVGGTFAPLDLACAPPPTLGYAENSILHVSQL